MSFFSVFSQHTVKAMASDVRVKSLLPRLLPHLGPLATKGFPECPAQVRKYQVSKFISPYFIAFLLLDSLSNLSA